MQPPVFEPNCSDRRGRGGFHGLSRASFHCTIQKRIAALEALKLLGREERRNTPNGSMTNRYHFDGLIEAARPFALEKAAEIKKAGEERSNRLKRKKPQLVVDNDA